MKIKINLNKYLESEKFNNLLEVQKDVFSILEVKNNLFCQSPTGTGKTLAYLLPILNQIEMDKKGVEAIILVPTNELIQQLKNQLLKINKYLNFSYFAITKNLDYDIEKNKYNKEAKIIISTIDKISSLQKKSPISYKKLKYVVVDEVDMIDNFKQLEQIKKFVDILKIKNNVSFSFFSATLEKNLQNKIEKLFKIKAKVINLNSKLEKKININLVKILNNDRLETLINLLKSNQFNPFFVIIFANKSKEVKKIYDYLISNNFKDIRYFSADLNIRKRKQIFTEVRNQRIIYLVTTDLYARGLDFNNVSHIINYDLPVDLNYFKHRIGRTNRSEDLKGKIYLLYNQNDQEKIKIIKNKNKNLTFKNLI